MTPHTTAVKVVGVAVLAVDPVVPVVPPQFLPSTDPLHQLSPVAVAVVEPVTVVQTVRAGNPMSQTEHRLPVETEPTVVANPVVVAVVEAEASPAREALKHLVDPVRAVADATTDLVASAETAAQLLAYTNSVTLLHHNDNVKADPVTVESVLKDPKMKLITNAELKKVIGDKFVEGILYLDKNTNEEKEIKADGVFVEIGSTPTTEFVSNIVQLDDFKRIKIDPWTQKSETEGIWAAGDCTNIKYHQNNIASGDAVKAVEDIYLYIKRNS